MTNWCHYASHLPYLLRALQVTEGPVLELGTGNGSTPVLHWCCELVGRRLVSMESDAKWVARFAAQFASPTHEVLTVTDWDAAPVEQSWAVVLVDHGPADRRQVELGRVTPHAQIVVVHDTNWYNEKHYHFKAHQRFEAFRYRYDSPYKPKTTVLSHTIDVGRWTWP